MNIIISNIFPLVDGLCGRFCFITKENYFICDGNFDIEVYAKGMQSINAIHIELDEDFAFVPEFFADYTY